MSDVLRLSGAQIDAIEPPVEWSGFVDWDEHEDFVPIESVQAAIAAEVDRLRAADNADLYVAGMEDAGRLIVRLFADRGADREDVKK